MHGLVDVGSAHTLRQQHHTVLNNAERTGFHRVESLRAPGTVKTNSKAAYANTLAPCLLLHPLHGLCRWLVSSHRHAFLMLIECMIPQNRHIIPDSTVPKYILYLRLRASSRNCTHHQSLWRPTRILQSNTEPYSATVTGFHSQNSILIYMKLTASTLRTSKLVHHCLQQLQ